MCRRGHRLRAFRLHIGHVPSGHVRLTRRACRSAEAAGLVAGQALRPARHSAELGYTQASWLNQDQSQNALGAIGFDAGTER